MKVGFHSPLPPARTGVADYSARLVAELKRRGEVSVGPEQADVHLYHLGNNQLHRDTHSRALSTPGVVVLHDAVLQHFFLGSLGESDYVEEFVFNYGAWRRDLAGELWRGRPRSAQDPRYFQFPMLRRVAEASRAVVVHNPGAAAMVRQHAPNARVVEIPMLFQAPEHVPVYEVARMREGWGVRQGAILFGVFGHLRESKRLMSVLRAFRTVRTRRTDAALLIAGECGSSDLARAMTPWLGQPGIIRIGYTPEREFWRLAGAVDVCINLRYPSAGETSAIAIGLMGIGKATMVTDGPETSRLPDPACLRVDAGVAEQEMLEAYMLWLAESFGTAAEIGRRAAEHIRREHSLGTVADRYWQLLESCRD